MDRISQTNVFAAIFMACVTGCGSPAATAPIELTITEVDWSFNDERVLRIHCVARNTTPSRILLAKADVTRVTNLEFISDEFHPLGEFTAVANHSTILSQKDLQVMGPEGEWRFCISMPLDVSQGQSITVNQGEKETVLERGESVYVQIRGENCAADWDVRLDSGETALLSAVAEELGSNLAVQPTFNSNRLKIRVPHHPPEIQ